MPLAPNTTMMRTGIWLGLAVIGVAVASCGTGGSDGSSADPSTAAPPSSTAAVQQVSDETICDLLFRDNGVMVKSVSLMSTRQTDADSARQARQYAREADRIGSHARANM